jgi:hypothetical protein
VYPKGDCDDDENHLGFICDGEISKELLKLYMKSLLNAVRKVK